MPAQPAFLREETSDDRRMSLFPTLRWIRTLGVKCIAGAAEGVLRVRQFQAWWFLGAEVADELRRVVRSARRQPKRSRNGEPRRFTQSPSGTFTRPGLLPVRSGPWARARRVLDSSDTKGVTRKLNEIPSRVEKGSSREYRSGRTGRIVAGTRPPCSSVEGRLPLARAGLQGDRAGRSGCVG